jgi:sugar fermentation stimulation protein A
MIFHQPIQAKILKRYKRFLADIVLPDNTTQVAHVPNTGAMTTCWEPNWPVIVTYHDDPKRKLKYTLQATYNGNTWIGVNTALTNSLVLEALQTQKISELSGYQQIKPEAKIYDSRIDFFLTNNPHAPECYVEVKNVTLIEEKQTAIFPDTVSTRGQKHLKTLIEIKKMGMRAVMLYVVQRQDCLTFAPASKIDPIYVDLLIKAKESGVEIYAYQCELSPNGISISHKMEVYL